MSADLEGDLSVTVTVLRVPLLPTRKERSPVAYRRGRLLAVCQPLAVDGSELNVCWPTRW